VAVLVLRDVLGFHANEVAEMLDSTVDAITSALKRARATLQRRKPYVQAPVAESPAERSLVAAFARAYQSGDVDALLALLTDDVFISMPPIPLEYRGRDAAARLFTSIFDSGRRVDLVSTRANAQPAFGAYLRHPTGVRPGSALFVLTLAGNRVCAFTRFDSIVFPWFGLPRSLPPARVPAG
jgi:RNA polymerase sigma-70 factor (ECF subfamily)